MIVFYMLKVNSNFSVMSFGPTKFIRVNLIINHKTIDFTAMYGLPSLRENDFLENLVEMFSNSDYK